MFKDILLKDLKTIKTSHRPVLVTKSQLAANLSLTNQELADKFGVSKSYIAKRKRSLGLKKQGNKSRKTHEEYASIIAEKGLCIEEPYRGTATKIKHRCTNCDHVWSVLPKAILAGTNCPICTEGYRYLYVIKFSDGLLKVGVTNNPKGRQKLGESYETLSFLECKDNKAKALEQKLLEYVRPYLVNTNRLVSGNTETYIIKE